MYIMINDIKGERRIDLSYSIDSDKEIQFLSDCFLDTENNRPK